MLGSASSEFITLCQSQVLLLTQALGASSTVVYLAEQSSDQVSPNLIPLVAYPDNAMIWNGLENALSTMEKALPATPRTGTDPGGLLLLGQEEVTPSAPREAAPLEADSGVEPVDGGSPRFPSARATGPGEEVENPASPQPLILPLAHEGVVLGVMVSTRNSPPWSRDDYQQAEQVAKTLAIAWVLDQRDQWLQLQMRQRQVNQANQSQTFHDLLHQFRNPLTALQTFGKLLLKRMQTDDPNQFIAEGIVRETGRLQELAQNFDAAIARGDEDLEQPVTPVPLNRLLLPGSADPSDLPKTTPGDTEYPAAVDQAPHPPGLGRAVVLTAGTIGSVAEPLLLSAQAIAQDRDRVLVHHIPPNLPEVWLDQGALREVVSNLLDNALKYAPRGALIWVTGGLVQQLNDTFYQGIAIGDTGPGIPRQDQDHIFERHYRGVQAAGETPGTGLGLAIVEELVEAMEGHIDLISPVQLDHWLPPEVHPRNSGPGSLFIVWLKTV